MTEVITEILPNDVLLGRGALAIGNQGNIRFRAVIKKHGDAYVHTSRRQLKAIVATEVRAEISNRGGRFLRRVRSDTERLALGIAVGVQAWVAADEHPVKEKIKQALRDYDESRGARTEGGSARVTRVGRERSDSKQKPQKRHQVINEMKRQQTAPEASQVAGGSSILTRTRDHQIWRETQNANLSDVPLEGRHRAGIFTGSYFSPQPIDLGEILPGQVGMGSQLESSSLFHINPHQELELQERIEQLENDRAATLERLHDQESSLALLRSASIRSRLEHIGQNTGALNNFLGQQSSSSAAYMLQRETLLREMTSPLATLPFADRRFAPDRGTTPGLGMPQLPHLLPQSATTIGNPLFNPNRFSPQREEQRAQIRATPRDLDILEMLVRTNARNNQQQQPPGGHFYPRRNGSV